MNTIEGKQLIIFDLDGTLVEAFTTDLLPGVAEWFEANRDRYVFALAHNAGGVGLRAWMETGRGFGEPSKFPTEQDARVRCATVTAALGGTWDIHMCFAYQAKQSGNWGPTPGGLSPLDSRQPLPEWRADHRKPAPGMLNAALRNAVLPASSAIYVGDWPEDRQAANAAGIDFVVADAFFGVE